jgi:hypothetical protein
VFLLYQRNGMLVVQRCRGFVYRCLVLGTNSYNIYLVFKSGEANSDIV